MKILKNRTKTQTGVYFFHAPRSTRENRNNLCRIRPIRATVTSAPRVCRWQLVCHGRRNQASQHGCGRVLCQFVACGSGARLLCVHQRRYCSNTNRQGVLSRCFCDLRFKCRLNPSCLASQHHHRGSITNHRSHRPYRKMGAISKNTEPRALRSAFTTRTNCRNVFSSRRKMVVRTVYRRRPCEISKPRV